MSWLRRYLRRTMNPIDEVTARKWKQRLSLAYMLIAWNTFGLLAYAWYQGKGDWADYYGLKTESDKLMPNNEYFARTIGPAGKVQLVTVRGFNVVDSREFDVLAARQEAAKDGERIQTKEEEAAYRRRKVEELIAARKKENQEEL